MSLNVTSVPEFDICFVWAPIIGLSCVMVGSILRARMAATILIGYQPRSRAPLSTIGNTDATVCMPCTIVPGFSLSLVEINHTKVTYISVGFAAR